MMQKQEEMHVAVMFCDNSKPIVGSDTSWGEVHLHFAQGERLPLPGDDHVHKATFHAASLTVERLGFTRGDVGDQGTPERRGGEKSRHTGATEKPPDYLNPGNKSTFLVMGPSVNCIALFLSWQPNGTSNLGLTRFSFW